MAFTVVAIFMINGLKIYVREWYFCIRNAINHVQAVLFFFLVFNAILQRNTSTLINFRLNDFARKMPNAMDEKCGKNISTALDLKWLVLKPTKIFFFQHDHIIHSFFISMQHISPRIQLIIMNFDFFTTRAAATTVSAAKSNGLSCLNMLKCICLEIIIAQCASWYCNTSHYDFRNNLLSYASFGFHLVIFCYYELWDSCWKLVQWIKRYFPPSIWCKWWKSSSVMHWHASWIKHTTNRHFPLGLAIVTLMYVTYTYILYRMKKFSNTIAVHLLKHVNVWL